VAAACEDRGDSGCASPRDAPRKPPPAEPGVGDAVPARERDDSSAVEVADDGEAEGSEKSVRRLPGPIPEAAAAAAAAATAAGCMLLSEIASGVATGRPLAATAAATATVALPSSLLRAPAADSAAVRA